MKKTFVTLFALLALLAFAAPASAEDVYITSIRVAASDIPIYGRDESIGVNGNIYAVMTKLVFPDGKKKEIFARFVKESGGWTASYGNKKYGYIVDWPPHVEAIFDWLMDRTLR